MSKIFANTWNGNCLMSSLDSGRGGPGHGSFVSGSGLWSRGV